MMFLSKISELRLVMRPKWVEKDPILGVVIHDGKTIEFTGGRYETSDTEEIAFIQKQEGYGSRITVVDQMDITGDGTAMVTGATGTATSAPKRTFKCMRCGVEGFNSGFEIANHRKTGECDEIHAASQTDEAEK